MRRNFFVLAACVCLLAFVACGSRSVSKVAAGTGAEIAPAGSSAFVSVEVGPALRRWRQVAGLLDRVSGLSGVDQLSKSSNSVVKSVGSLGGSSTAKMSSSFDPRGISSLLGYIVANGDNVELKALLSVK